MEFSYINFSLAMAVSELQPAPTPNAVSLPRELPEPMWLKGLTVLQKLSLGTATLLTTAALISYSWSVHTQAQWNQQYQKLQILKRQERNLSAAIETFENDLVQNLSRYVPGLVRESREQSWYVIVEPNAIPTVPPASAVPPSLTPTLTPPQPIRGY
jgi:hypothetical protein